MEARSTTLEELEPHLESTFSNNPSLLPVSPLRLDSYLHNPRAQPSDRVLFEMWDERRLIAYRTLLPDCFFDESGNAHRFAWLSGNYVIPEYRRQGISTRLLQHAEASWEGRLMYTNYAPVSKAVYDRTGQFRHLSMREGARYYLRSASADLLKERMGNFTQVLKLGDRLANRLVERKLERFDQAPDETCTVSRISISDPSVRKLVENGSGGSLFRRDAEVFKWIVDHPWISEKKEPVLPYHFSWSADHFENLHYKFELRDGKGSGFLWLVVHDRKMSAPYLFTDREKILPHMARVFIETMISRKIAYATVRHPALNEALGDYRKWFLSVRSMPQLIFVHKMLQEKIPKDFSVQDGDGDVVFTG
jgi:GNAT superfamily N-acetyltransferase